MSLRSPSLRIAKALAEKPRPSALRQSPSSWRPLHRPSAAINYCSLPSAWRDTASNDPYLRSFSTEPEVASEPASSKGEASPPPPAGCTSEDSTTEGAAAAAAEDSTTEGAAAAADADAGSKRARVADLERQVKDLKGSYLRSLAEQEDARRIARQDAAKAKSYAITSFAKSLLDTSDNLSRALEAVPEDIRRDRENNPVLANLYEGIIMTDEGLRKAFEKNGLRRYGARGEKFDPNLHNALSECEDQEGEAPGNIGQVMKAGFMLNDRVIRPAEVGVVKGR